MSKVVLTQDFKVTINGSDLTDHFQSFTITFDEETGPLTAAQIADNRAAALRRAPLAMRANLSDLYALADGLPDDAEAIVTEVEPWTVEIVPKDSQ